jgi:hypothetical protein
MCPYRVSQRWLFLEKKPLDALLSGYSYSDFALPAMIERRYDHFVLQQPVSFKPMARKMAIAGHQFVKADCNRFNPTKAVSQSQYGEKK